MRTMNVTRPRSTVVSQARANGRFLVLQLDNNDANPTMRSCRKPGLVAPHPRVLARS